MLACALATLGPTAPPTEAIAAWFSRALDPPTSRRVGGPGPHAPLVGLGSPRAPAAASSGARGAETAPCRGARPRHPRFRRGGLRRPAPPVLPQHLRAARRPR